MHDTVQYIDSLDVHILLLGSNSFSQGTGNPSADNDWLASLTSVDAPAQSYQSPKPSSPSPAASRRQSLVSPQASIATPPPRPSSVKPGERDDLRALIQDQARTIATLESEKTSLTMSLEQLKHAEASQSVFCRL